MSHRGIGVQVEQVGSASSYRGFSSEIRAKKTSSVGTIVVPLLERLTTIPTKRTVYIVFEGDAAEDIQFTVVERSKTSTENVTIGVIAITAPGAEVTVEVSLDIDANSAMVLQVSDETNRIRALFQLNQHFREARTLFVRERVSLLLDGWSIAAPAHIAPGEVNRASASASERLETADIDEYMDELSGQAGNFSELAQRYLSNDTNISSVLGRGYTADAAEAVILRARMLELRGRNREAVDDLASALGLTATVAETGAFRRALEASEVVAKGLDEATRAAFATAILRAFPHSGSIRRDEVFERVCTTELGPRLAILLKSMGSKAGARKFASWPPRED